MKSKMYEVLSFILISSLFVLNINANWVKLHKKTQKKAGVSSVDNRYTLSEL
ncbi:hypothetical protein VCHA50P417_100148 [Vibrio chagasii]|nr:hypothetical protein VCHA50P417_100148 [Vibrio chagasii]CAH6948426.1 hypothetical protein VCHA48P442_100147 [Vibrio chagasii]